MKHVEKRRTRRTGHGFSLKHTWVILGDPEALPVLAANEKPHPLFCEAFPDWVSSFFSELGPALSRAKYCKMFSNRRREACRGYSTSKYRQNLSSDQTRIPMKLGNHIAGRAERHGESPGRCPMPALSKKDRESWQRVGRSVSRTNGLASVRLPEMRQ